ncbi:FkbM family methyltransferase [Hydrogenovibrio marinus]|uniref:Methyltransferase FkbM domain-containing protein n=1 Tax=Hydrogenovibrio marinus TaxID=28885 RepID=A0A066ZS52_HYDMR|nr:FkbM family methyltransferase [Hydrogenovibrio marinus]KDN96633.1 hypothetical protein EI16_10295 [Hydrogenovibrio marinus]BBN60156.1 hypothetical protein HVMH_1750 [Hydrogenovibrio marinus]
MSLKNFFKKSHVEVESYLDLLFLYAKDCVMLQIGANDGQLCDPIRKYVLLNKVKGVLLEPQIEVFKNLKENYQSVEGLNFVNKALSGTNGITSLYSVDDFLVRQYSDLSGVASFSRGHVSKEIKSNMHKLSFENAKTIDDYVVKTDVETITYSSLIKEYLINNLDLLMIDAEGFDYESVMLFPFDEVKPKAVLFEDKHIGKAKRTQLKSYLKDLGYIAYHARNDVLFVLEY